MQHEYKALLISTEAVFQLSTSGIWVNQRDGETDEIPRVSAK